MPLLTTVQTSTTLPSSLPLLGVNRVRPICMGSSGICTTVGLLDEDTLRDSGVGEMELRCRRSLVLSLRRLSILIVREISSSRLSGSSRHANSSLSWSDKA
ncbi:hypothetical protein ILYODFUR_008812 [Ilyodon furcidens]|uniref:Uncharacterized protein n=1 Tax=Ilyodon furcidens TaxID=33524 RepID=A0ABV0UFW0_9TELE